MKKKIKIVCSICNGDNVEADSIAKWNVKKQKWEACSVCDTFYCSDCDRECNPKEVKV